MGKLSGTGKAQNFAKRNTECKCQSSEVNNFIKGKFSIFFQKLFLMHSVYASELRFFSNSSQSLILHAYAHNYFHAASCIKRKL